MYKWGAQDEADLLFPQGDFTSDNKELRNDRQVSSDLCSDWMSDVWGRSLGYLLLLVYKTVWYHSSCVCFLSCYMMNGPITEFSSSINLSISSGTKISRYITLKIYRWVFLLFKNQPLRIPWFAPPPFFFGKRSRRILKGSRFNLFLPRSLKG